MYRARIKAINIINGVRSVAACDAFSYVRTLGLFCSITFRYVCILLYDDRFCYRA